MNTEETTFLLTVYEKLMEDVDVRSLLGKAQQELRVYLALENAWPRMKKGVSEKHAATADIVERLITSNVRYQREDFQKKFEPNWAFQKTKNKIIAYVRVSSPHHSVLTIFTFSR